MYEAPPSLSFRPESVLSVTSAPKPPVATLTNTYAVASSIKFRMKRGSSFITTMLAALRRMS